MHNIMKLDKRVLASLRQNRLTVRKDTAGRRRRGSAPFGGYHSISAVFPCAAQFNHRNVVQYGEAVSNR